MTCPQCNAPIVDEHARFCPQCAAVVDATGEGDPLRLALERVIGHQYTIERLLGRGGMGAVYLAHEEALDRHVAIKVLPPEASDETSRERFVREARVAARLTHPAIVPLHTFGELGGMMYFVMGYVEGESLEEVLQREGRLPERRCRALLVEVARALQYAHDLGIVHRDIKPDNILIDRNGRPHLTDFGIARAGAASTTLTEVGAVIGTPHYMSPEQVSGERTLDGRADQYALGVLAYRALAGDVPVSGESVQQILTRKLVTQPPPLPEVAPEVSERLAEAVMRALSIDAATRWPTMGALAEAIEVRAYGDGDVPSGLENTPTVSTVGILMMTVGTIGALWSLMGKTLRMALALGPTEAVLAGSAALGALILVKARQDGLAQGYPPDVVRRAMFRPPRWWVWRLPQWLRPADDVWERLPREVVAFRDRALRTVILVLIMFGLGLPLWGFAWSLWINTSAIPAQTARGVFATGLLAAVGVVVIASVLAIVAYVKALRMLKERGLSPADAALVLQTPTFGSDVWDRPELERLLDRDAPGGVSGEVLPLPSVLAAVERACGSDSNLVSDAERMVKEAYRLHDSLAREIALLEQDSAEAEVERLQQRLSELDGGGSEHVKSLIQGQLDLARELQTRLNATRQRASRLTRQLETLAGKLGTAQQNQPLPSEEVVTLIRGLESVMLAHDAPTARMPPPETEGASETTGS